MPGVGGDGGSSASGQLAALEGQLDQLHRAGLDRSHPDVVSRASRSPASALCRGASARSGNTGGMPNPSYVSLRAMMAEREAQLAAATARRNQLQSDLAQLTSRQSTEPGVAAEQSRLTRDYDVLKQQYDTLLANREQVRLRSDVQTPDQPAQVQVVEPPSVPSVPAAPNRPIFLTLVLFVGARRRRRRGLRRRPAPDHLPDPAPPRRRSTGLPVLGTVSEVVTAAERRPAPPAPGLARRRRRRRSAPAGRC